MAKSGGLAEALEWQFRNEVDKQIRKTHESGQTLYHYTSLQSLMGMIETNNLWMSKGNFLNDSSELIYFSNVLKSVVGKMEIQRETELWQLFIRELEGSMKRFLEGIEGSGFEVYIFSLSYSPDSLALWYNYAKGEGYNLGFDAEELLQKASAFPDESDVLHGLVVYDRQEQELILMNFLIETFKRVVQYEPGDIKKALPRHFLSVIATCAIFFKDPAFKSEEEYRIAYKNTSGTMHSAVRFRAQNGVIIPFITVDFEERLPISHITIGPKNNIDIAKRGIEHYLKSKGYNMKSLSINKSVAALRY
ncbi:hypothetical protein AC739_06245 [Planococcus glaciei]|uniref:DUF2971 domain-containing protein n=1 Tax=Planococcus glaciei TaxID=459472 RepID=UPI00069ECD6E|nr:DUF2971 domain-containing protein [Planococcus glaciei]KOF10990.1 hypothetical protein AC739_06245 [Planococcus glaciei]MBX0315763.1 DUF2971 domain-containing protein [Planococcus glaciei]